MSADCESVRPENLRLQRMAGSTGRTAAATCVGERQFRAASEGDPKLLDFNGFGYGQGILKFDAEVSDRTVHLGVA